MRTPTSARCRRPTTFAAGLAAADPAHRALAIAGNAIACTLEEKAARSAEERDLMILAARTARHHWAIAGTWLETERAEYRLAMTWLQAGDPAQARTHARNCLGIVAANDGAALERFFGWEALGSVERAAGTPTSTPRRSCTRAPRSPNWRLPTRPGARPASTSSPAEMSG